VDFGQAKALKRGVSDASQRQAFWLMDIIINRHARFRSRRIWWMSRGRCCRKAAPCDDRQCCGCWRCCRGYRGRCGNAVAAVDKSCTFPEDHPSLRADLCNLSRDSGRVLATVAAYLQQQPRTCDSSRGGGGTGGWRMAGALRQPPRQQPRCNCRHWRGRQQRSGCDSGRSGGLSAVAPRQPAQQPCDRSQCCTRLPSRLPSRLLSRESSPRHSSRGRRDNSHVLPQPPVHPAHRP
jgi:hypothetical protein